MLEAAYNDSAGVTAAFNKNVLSVLNRELGANFDLDAFEHVAFWDHENLWVDIRLRSLARQVIEISSLGMRVAFDRGEEMRTEISTKFAREGLSGIYAEAGLEIVGWWTDPDGSSPCRSPALEISRRLGSGYAGGRARETCRVRLAPCPAAS